MSTKKSGKKQSGNPAKRAEQAALAATRVNPCPRCPTGQRTRSKAGLSIWCLNCSGRAKRAGKDNKPSPEAIKQTIIGLAFALDLMDDDGELLDVAA